MLTLRVLLPLPLPAFSYGPPHGEDAPPPGARVVVPWQNGVRIGLVTAHEEAGGSLDLKEIVATLDQAPFVRPPGLRLIHEVAEYTGTPAGLVLATFLPTGLHDALSHEVRALPGVTGVELPERWVSADTLRGVTLELYRRQGLVGERVRPLPQKVSVLRALKPPDGGLDGAPQANQRRALEHLWAFENFDSAAALARDAEVPESAARRLVTKGYAEYAFIDAPLPALPCFEPTALPDPPRGLGLNALEPLSISGGARRDRLAALLPLLQADVRAGGSALVLVPEGHLVSETAAALCAHLPVMVLNGDLKDAQRARVWAEVSSGDPVVLVSSYLGLLAPFPALARVVVLEEGSGSYKLLSGSRLFLPTAARILAEAAGAPLVLTDALATPETYGRLPAPQRATLPTPPMRTHVTDLYESTGWPLSADLVRVLKQVEARGRQAVLLAPRRGFSAALACAECRWLAPCPNCDLPLRYHRDAALLRCHQCGFVGSPPALCPACRGDKLEPTRAAGTQWVASEVAKLLPGLPSYRLDSDRRDDLSPLLGGAPGVLVATTAALRHAPLPNVSLLAVTLLDSFLSFGDFRAEEETFRLLLNLAELAPERRPLLLIQTFQPEHPALHAFTGHESGETFLARLLERRQRFDYPPFSVMAKLQVSARQAGAAERAAAWLASAIRTHGANENELLGPTPAPVARVRNQYTYQLFLRARDEGRLAKLLEPARNYQGAARLRFDVDPRDMSGFIE